MLQHVTEENEFKKAIFELARVCRINGRILVLEASPRTRKPMSSDFPTAFRSIADWTETFKKAELKIERTNGVDPSIFLKPLLELKKKIIVDAEIYQCELSGKSWAETPVKKAMKLAYFTAINMAIIFSIPFDFSLRNLFKNICLHKLFVLQKLK